MFPAHKLSLYFVMGSQNCAHLPPVDVLQQAIRGGITCFQFREKQSGLTMGETLSLGRVLRKECRKHGIPFIVNDRVDLALLLEADGIHVGQDDIPASEVRRLTGSQMWIGVSVQTAEEAERAILDGADYVGVGPMFPTRSKTDAEEPIGPNGLAALRARLTSTIPVVAIGGISSPHVPDIIAAGADGIAVISAIASQQNPEQAARNLFRIVQVEKKEV